MNKLTLDKIPDHTLIMCEDTTKNISVVRSAVDKDTFLAFETNWGEERWSRTFKLFTGPDGEVVVAQVNVKSGPTRDVLCANRSSAYELFQDLFHIKID